MLDQYTRNSFKTTKIIVLLSPAQFYNSFFSPYCVRVKVQARKFNENKGHKKRTKNKGSTHCCTNYNPDDQAEIYRAPVFLQESRKLQHINIKPNVKSHIEPIVYVYLLLRIRCYCTVVSSLMH